MKRHASKQMSNHLHKKGKHPLQRYGMLAMLCVLCFTYIVQVIYVKSNDQDRIAIIGYHHIVSDEDKETYFKHNMWVSSLSSFKEQMKLLHDEGYQSVTLDDVYAWYKGELQLPKKRVVITFDDGFYSTSAFAKPVLESYGFKGSVFVIGSLIPKKEVVYDPSKRQHASLEDMKDQSVLQYYSHSYDLHHKKNGTFKINTQSKKQLIKDIEKEKTLVSITYYAYPYGKYNETIQEVLRSYNVALAFSYNENRKASRNDDPYALPRFNINAYTTIDGFKSMLESY